MKISTLILWLRLFGPFDATILRGWVPWWKVREDGLMRPRPGALKG